MEAKEGTFRSFLQGQKSTIQNFNSLKLNENSWEAKIIFAFLKDCSLDQETKKHIYSVIRNLDNTINGKLAVQIIEEAEQGKIVGVVRSYPATITKQEPEDRDYFTNEFRTKHINKGQKSQSKDENIKVFKDRKVPQNTLISNSENGKNRLTKELKTRQKEYELVYAFLEKKAKEQNTTLESVVFTSTLPINVTSINQEEIHKRQIQYSGSDETYFTYIRYSVQPFKVEETANKKKKNEIICYFVNHFDGEVETKENNKPGFALLVSQRKGLGININVGTLFRFANFDRNAVQPPVDFQSDLAESQSIFPIQPVEFNYSFSDEPILLNGMKVLFDNPTPTTPVTLQPKQRGTNNGR